MSNQPNKLILVFGSLRKLSKRGYNFNRCGPQKYIRSLTLEGYDLFSLGSYPAICRGKGTLHCELHEVDNETYESISNMELGAAYSEGTVDLPEGPATIYLYPSDRLTNRQKVESGDWN